MKIFHAFIALLFAATTIQAQSKTNNADAGFKLALAKAGMTFIMPKGAVKTPVVKNKQINYQYAVKYPTRNLEIRYAVFPRTSGTTTQVNRNAKGELADDPFDSFSLDIAAKVAGGTKDPKMQVGGFDPGQAKKEFGADKVTFWMINLKNNSFGTQYKFCNMVAMHKDKGSYAYMFFLCNSIQDLTKNFREIGPYNVYYNLKFK